VPRRHVTRVNESCYTDERVTSHAHQEIPTLWRRWHITILRWPSNERANFGLLFRYAHWHSFKFSNFLSWRIITEPYLWHDLFICMTWTTSCMLLQKTTIVRWWRWLYCRSRRKNRVIPLLIREELHTHAYIYSHTYIHTPTNTRIRRCRYWIYLYTSCACECQCVCMCVCVCVCVLVCMCMCMCVYVYVYVYVCACVWEHMN